MCIFKKKKKVALVLGSGGARGLAHIGVIKSLVKNGVPIDMIVGSSSGALIGALYALWKDIDRVEEITKGVTLKDLAGVLMDPSFGGGLVKGDRTMNFFKKYFEDKKIEEMKIEFEAVATDVNTAERVVFDRGSIIEAIRASISIPLVYSPIENNKRVLVDGGVSCPVPVEVAKERGAEVVIAVNLDGIYFLDNAKKNSPSSSVIEVLKNSYFALRYNLAKKEVKEADVLIEPVMKFIGDFDFIKGKEAIEAGELATDKLVHRIKKLV